MRGAANLPILRPVISWISSLAKTPDSPAIITLPNGDNSMARHLSYNDLINIELFNEAAIRQVPQTCFGIASTGERGADLPWICERSPHPDFARPRDKRSSPKYVDRCSRASLAA
jgi:hypothetical protein